MVALFLRHILHVFDENRLHLVIHELSPHVPADAPLEQPHADVGASLAANGGADKVILCEGGPSPLRAFRGFQLLLRGGLRGGQAGGGGGGGSGIEFA